MATLPHILLNGTTADADPVNENFDEIYSNIDSTNIAAGNRTGTAAGKIVLQTSATIITPTLSGNITLISASFTNNFKVYAGDFTVYADAGVTNKFSVDGSNGNTQLNGGATLKIYSDAGTTQKFGINGATGDTGVAATAKLFLDGANLGGDTYINEVSANTIRIVTGGTSAVDISATLFNVNSGLDLTINSTKKFYLDGVGDTFISESSANVVTLSAGADLYTFDTSKLSIPSGNTISFAGNGQVVLNVATTTSIFYNSSTVVVDFNGSQGAVFRNGSPDFPTHGTTGSAANAFLDSVTGSLKRSTSSIKYKENVANLETDSSLIYGLRPVSYDDKISKIRYFGLIAEEVNELLPCLVDHRSDNGQCEYVYYDRLSVLLLNEIKKLKEKVEALSQ